MRITWILILFIAMTGCQVVQVEEGEQASPHGPPPGEHNAPHDVRAVDVRTPEMWEQADPSCTTENALLDLGTVEVWLFDNKRKLVKESVDLSGVSGNGLQARFSDGTFVDYMQITRLLGCFQKSDKVFSCRNSKIEIENQGRLLPICRRTGYPARSLENAALVAAISMKNAFEALGVAKQAYVKKIEVLLLPRLAELVDGEGLAQQWLMTDNAYWSAWSVRSKKPVIAILPHSLELRKAFATDLPLQPGVIGHEYGHHISSLHVSTAFSLGEALERPWEALQYLVESLTSGQARVVKKWDVIAIANEAFGDIYARISWRDKEFSAGQIFYGRGSANRNVESPICDDGKPKGLTPSVLKHLFSDRVSFPDTPGTPNHQDTHTAGAFLAYAFMALTAAECTEVMMQRLLVWASTIDRLFPFSGEVSEKDLLERVSWLNVYAALGSSPTASPAQCDVINQVFGPYVRTWIKREGLSCKA